MPVVGLTTKEPPDGGALVIIDIALKLRSADILKVMTAPGGMTLASTNKV